MKTVIIFFALAASCVLATEVSREWQQFQETFVKTYKSPVESRIRFAIFQENLEDIEKHNQRFENGEVTWKKGVNQFSDWTKEEFMEYVNKNKFEGKLNFPEKKMENLTAPLPSAVDWRQYGYVSPVKNQGQCGSCWTFSATGTIESLYRRVKGSQVLLSEQNLVDCVTRSNGYNSLGCNGGFPTDAFQYVRQNGIDTESNYPYEGRDGSCRQRTRDNKIDSFYTVQASENALMQAVASYGPISVALEATVHLQSYARGILYDNSCTNKINHAVLAVGYGTENGQNYWIVKNSWGASWGEAGYFRLSRVNNNCAIQNMASFAYMT